MTDRELMQMAFQEIERLCNTGKITGGTLKLATTLRDRLAKPERKWAELTEKEIFEHEWWDEETAFHVNKYLKEKNDRKRTKV